MEARQVEPFFVQGRLGLYRVQVPVAWLPLKLSAEALPEPTAFESGCGLSTLALSEKGVYMTTYHHCFTFGYQGQKSEELLAAVNEMGAVLCDIRLVPYSRWQPAWNKRNLQVLFGDSYQHIPQLGNLNYKNGGPLAIADMEAGLQMVLDLLEQQPVVLMCVCRNTVSCHRLQVAQRLLGLSIQVNELDLPLNITNE